MALTVSVRRRQRGHAFLEFAVGASVFIALFSGAYEFGYTFHAYESLLSGVRAGARFGAMASYPLDVQTADSTPASAFTTAVQNVTVYGDPAGAVNGAKPIIPGLTTAHVLVTVQFTNSVPSTVMVCINGFRIDSILGNWVANRKPQATFTYLGRYDPPAP
jgi:Flp pilus assembly protein TadG